MATADTQRPPEQNRPAYWFIALERAVEHGDFERAALAQKELLRLGVDVVYRPTTRKEVASGQ